MAPRRNMPRASWQIPTSSARRIAKATNCSEPTAASDARTEPVNRETIATGPVASWLEEPQRAPPITGRNAAYRPEYGGSPASGAYAIDWGISTSATVIPAIRSARTVSDFSGNQRANGATTVQGRITRLPGLRDPATQP